VYYPLKPIGLLLLFSFILRPLNVRLTASKKQCDELK